MHSAHLIRSLHLIVFFLIYLGTYQKILSPIWISSGLSLGAVLVFGTYLWPAIALGSFVSIIISGISLPMAFGIALGNTLEVLIGVHLLYKYFDFDKSLRRLKDVFALVGVASFLGGFVSASIGVTTLCLGSFIPWSAFTFFWVTWWIRNCTSDLVLVPILLIWSAPLSLSYKSLFSRGLLEVVVLIGTVLLVSVLILGGGDLGYGHGEHSHQALLEPYFFFPVLLWAAIQFGQHWTVLITTLISIAAFFGVSSGYGYLGHQNYPENLLHLQIFLSVIIVTVLCLSALITERSQLLKQLKRAVQARDDVLAIVSHDLKNPLGAIFLNCQLLTRMASNNTHERFVRSQADRIQNDAERMRKLINNLLDLAKIESGHFTIDKKNESISNLLNESIEMFRPQAADKSISLEINLTPKLVQISQMEEVNCDKDRILQVFSNLIGNAIKFTSPHGKIEVGANINKQEAVFFIKDTGPGIPEASLPHIFDRYWQATKNVKHSLGLGLFIAKEIVEAHQGRIWAESRVGEGTTFYFTLPVPLFLLPPLTTSILYPSDSINALK